MGKTKKNSPIQSTGPLVRAGYALEGRLLPRPRHKSPPAEMACPLPSPQLLHQPQLPTQREQQPPHFLVSSLQLLTWPLLPMCIL